MHKKSLSFLSQCYLDKAPVETMRIVEVRTAINRGAGDRVLLREDRHSQSGAGRGPSPKGHDGSGVMVLGSRCKRRHCHVERRGALLVSLDR